MKLDTVANGALPSTEMLPFSNQRVLPMSNIQGLTILPLLPCLFLNDDATKLRHKTNFASIDGRNFQKMPSKLSKRCALDLYLHERRDRARTFFRQIRFFSHK